VRDQRQPERPIARRAKQHGVRGDVGVGRGDQPLLHTTRLAFGAPRAESHLRNRALRTWNAKHNHNENRLERLHEFACRDPSEPANSLAAAKQSPRIFCVKGAPIKVGSRSLCPPNHHPGAAGALPCPLSVQRGEKLMPKIHRLTDN
jgi:hypothetical protein